MGIPSRNWWCRWCARANCWGYWTWTARSWRVSTRRISMGWKPWRASSWRVLDKSGQLAAHLHRAAGSVAFFPADAILGKQQDHRRTHVEASHFRALGQLHFTRVIPALYLRPLRWRHFTGPHGLDARHVQRTHHHQGYGSGRRVEETSDPFVTGK